MSSSFFIAPNDPLAIQVVDDIRRMSPDTLISPRGEIVYWADGTSSNEVYSVCSLPSGSRQYGYEWAYFPVSQWLAEYDACH